MPLCRIAPAVGFCRNTSARPIGGLARPGLADDAERLAAADVEVDAVDRLHRGAAILRLELHLEIAHRDDGVRLAL